MKNSNYDIGSYEKVTELQKTSDTIEYRRVPPVLVAKYIDRAVFH